MYAVIRESTLRPEAQGQYAAALKEFAAIRAQQPGYRSSVTIDAGDGRRVSVVLWESEQAQATSAPVLQPQAERLMGALWSSPSHIVYQGLVVADDLTAR